MFKPNCLTAVWLIFFLKKLNHIYFNWQLQTKGKNNTMTKETIMLLYSIYALSVIAFTITFDIVKNDKNGFLNIKNPIILTILILTPIVNTFLVMLFYIKLFFNDVRGK